MWAPFVLDTKDVDVLHEYEKQRRSRKETLCWPNILTRRRLATGAEFCRRKQPSKGVGAIAGIAS